MIICDYIISYINFQARKPAEEKYGEVYYMI